MAKAKGHPDIKEYMFGKTITFLKKQVSKTAKLSIVLFACALALIGLFAIFSDLLPACVTPAKTIKMSIVIQIVIFLIGGTILFICWVKPTDVVQNTIFQTGMVTVVAI